MNSLDQGPEGGACGENKYSNNTRLDREDRCSNCNRKLYLGFETFCCCMFEDNMEDSSLHCVELEDYLTDEEQISETLASSLDNNSLKWLEDTLKLSSNYSVSLNSLEIEPQIDRLEETMIQDILDMEFEELENPLAENNEGEYESTVQNSSEPLEYTLMMFIRECLEGPSAEVCHS